jgi:hypothetical protein
MRFMGKASQFMLKTVMVEKWGLYPSAKSLLYEGRQYAILILVSILVSAGLSHHLFFQYIPYEVLGELCLPLDSLHSFINAHAFGYEVRYPADDFIADSIIFIYIFAMSPNISP